MKVPSRKMTRLKHARQLIFKSLTNSVNQNCNEFKILNKKETFEKLFWKKFEVEDGKINKTIMSKINTNNCLVIYYSSTFFKLSTPIKISISLIKRCFPMFANSENFLELGFNYIRKILSSSGLNIDSELQIFNAADSWLCHDITEKSKYAKEFLSTVRYPPCYYEF